MNTVKILSLSEFTSGVSGVSKFETGFRSGGYNYSFYKIDNGICVGGGVSGVMSGECFVFIEESIIVRNNVDGYLRKNCRQSIEKESKFLSGEWMFLNDSWSGTFWHWMVECVPKIIILEMSGYSGGYVVPHGFSFVEESMVMMGIDAGRIRADNDSVFVVDKLIVCDVFWGQTTFFDFPQVLFHMRRIFFDAIPFEKGGDYDKRLYIARDHSRRIVNEGEFIDVIRKYGFSNRYLMENYSLANQIDLVRNANLIIGPHGAGMALTMFMPPASVFIELFPPTYINPCMLATAKHLRQRAYSVVSSVMVPYSSYDYGTDIVANVGYIDQILDGLI